MMRDKVLKRGAVFLRRPRFLLGLVGFLGTAGFSLGQNAFSVSIGGNTHTYATFQDAVYAANGATSAATLSIDHALTGGTVSLSSQLVIGLNQGNTGGLTIQGNGVTIDMNHFDRAFFIASGSVNLANLTINNGLALGGNGGLAGGGGAGLGGAIFVANPTAITSSGYAGGFANPNLASPTAVTLSGVSFTNNVATGGQSLSQSQAGPYQAGGGGGMGGNGGSGVTNDFSVIGGGGGGFGNGANGGTYNNGDGPWHGTTGAMIFTASPLSAAPIGGPGAGESDNGGLYGGGGGMGENDDFDDQAGGGGGTNGVGGDSSNGGAGGFGGGGGGATSYSATGGQGGFGGGGGGAVDTTSVGTANPGNGGFGGGGGASTSNSNISGAGGFAAGNGYILSGSYVFGGYGASLGGAIFVMDGASLTITSGTFTSNNAWVPAGADTTGYGNDLFLGGDVTFEVATGDTLSLNNLGGAGNLADPNVARNQNDANAQGGIIVQGLGTVQLTGSNNYYSGHTVINAGTLALASGAVETGTASVTVGQSFGNNGTLALGSSSGLFLKGFDPNDPQSSTDVPVRIAQGEGSEGKIVIGSGAGSGGAFIGARVFNGGDGDASVEFQQNYAAGSTTNPIYPFQTTLTGRINLYQTGPGTTVLNPMYGSNSFAGAVFITDGTIATAGGSAALAGVAQITMNGGDFEIGQSHGINDAVVLNQGSGTFRIGIDNLEEEFAGWNITATTILDFNTFAADLAFSWLNVSGNLSIYNYDPSIDFLTIFSGSAVGDLSQISFYSDAGNTLLGTAAFNGTSLVAVPEPAWASLVGVSVGVLCLVRRNRRPRAGFTAAPSR